MENNKRFQTCSTKFLAKSLSVISPTEICFSTLTPLIWKLLLDASTNACFNLEATTEVFRNLHYIMRINPRIIGASDDCLINGLIIDPISQECPFICRWAWSGCNNQAEWTVLVVCALKIKCWGRKKDCKNLCRFISHSYNQWDRIS